MDNLVQRGQPQVELKNNFVGGALVEILFTTTMLKRGLFLVLKAQRSLTSTVSSCLGKGKPACKLTCKNIYTYFVCFIA